MTLKEYVSKHGENFIIIGGYSDSIQKYRTLLRLNGVEYEFLYEDTEGITESIKQRCHFGGWYNQVNIALYPDTIEQYRFVSMLTRQGVLQEPQKYMFVNYIDQHNHLMDVRNGVFA